MKLTLVIIFLAVASVVYASDDKDYYNMSDDRKICKILSVESKVTVKENTLSIEVKDGLEATGRSIDGFIALDMIPQSGKNAYRSLKGLLRRFNIDDLVSRLSRNWTFRLLDLRVSQVPLKA